MDIDSKNNQLAEEVNSALRKSYKSNDPEEKRELFFLAVRKLNELKELVRETPGARITGLTKFENTLDEIEQEYYDEGVFKDELFCGWIFNTNFRLETPLASLLNHGEFRETLDDLSAVTSNQKDGGWVQKTTSFREMGLDVSEPKQTFIASIVGPIPPKGGLFLDYLIELRRIVESETDIELKQKLLYQVLDKQQYYDFNKKLGGRDAVVKKLLKSLS